MNNKSSTNSHMPVAWGVLYPDDNIRSGYFTDDEKKAKMWSDAGAKVVPLYRQSHKRNKIMCYCNNSWICDICIIVCLIGCFFLGWAFGVKHMRQQAVSFNVATYQANESGGPEFVWKNMENK